MKIIELHVENFKRLKAVTIRPGENNVVEISGRNAQGKSSAIDAIWAALQGVGGAAEHACARPQGGGEGGDPARPRQVRGHPELDGHGEHLSHRHHWRRVQGQTQFAAETA
jgi:hypothetical protein